MFKFDLLENEKLETMVRQTEWVLLKPVALVFVLIYIPWFFLIKYELVEQFHRLLLAWTILVFLYSLYKYLLWLLNVNLITNKRLVAVTYRTLIHKKVAESTMDRIANISVSSTGALSSLFDYGDVEVQIINASQPMLLKNVRRPAAIKDYIWKQTVKKVSKNENANYGVENNFQKRKVV